MRILVAILILIMAFSLYHHDQQRKEIVDLNSEIIDSVGLVGATQSRISSLLINILAENEDVDLGDRSDFSQYTVSGFPDDDDVVPTTHSQIIRDLNEIDTSIDAIWMNNIRQEESCRLILEHLQNDVQD